MDPKKSKKVKIKVKEVKREGVRTEECRKASAVAHDWGHRWLGVNTRLGPQVCPQLWKAQNSYIDPSCIWGVVWYTGAYTLLAAVWWFGRNQWHTLGFVIFCQWEKKVGLWSLWAFNMFRRLVWHSLIGKKRARNKELTLINIYFRACIGYMGEKALFLSPQNNSCIFMAEVWSGLLSPNVVWSLYRNKKAGGIQFLVN